MSSVDSSGGIATGRKETLPSVDSNGSISSSAAAGGGSKPDLKGFMTKIGADFHKAGGEVARGFQKALDETSKGLQKVAQVLEEVPDRLAPKVGQQQQASLPQYPHPDLATLFAAKPLRSSTTAPAGHGSSSLSGPPAASSGSSGSLGAAVSADSSMARVGSADGSSGFGSTLGTSPQLTQQAPQAGRKVRASDPTDSMTRSEQFAGSPSPRTASGSGEPGSRPGSGSAGSAGSAGAGRGALSPAAPPGATVSGLVGPSGGTPRVRTAEEIRQAYGRPQLSKAQGTASVMEQNRMLLGQRGEKLSRLQEATGDLAETAAGFAEMAKKLAEQEKQKTRWFG